jgi:hypothetical protein
LIKNLQDLELDNYRKSAALEEKDLSLKSLLRENDMLNEKLKTLETDMKVVLNNRKKLDNLEDIIAQFIHNENEEPLKISKNNHFSNLNTTNNMSTKLMTRTYSQNVFSPTNTNVKETIYEFPERDQNINYTTQVNHVNNSSNLNSTSAAKMPKWYLNLKMKDKMK